MGVYPSPYAPIPQGDLEAFNTDRGVFPPVMMRGLLVKNTSGEWVAQGPISPAGFNIPEYDYISLGYTGSNLTSVIYKVGGVSGTAVGELTLGYTGSDLTSVEKI